VLASLVLVVLIPAASVGAQSPHCRRAHADARSRAYLLMSPSITTQALHLPRLGDESGMALFQQVGWQARLGLSWSVLDVIRGAWVLDAAGSECARFEARARVERMLEHAPDHGRLEALREERDFLDESAPRVEALVAQGDARRAELRATQHQVNALHLRANELRRRRSQVQAEIERLEADDAPEPVDVREELATYEHAALALERTDADVRRLDAWRVQVRVGLVPSDTVDWFGALELTYNIGGIAQWLAEDERVAARADELAEARYELRQRVERFERRVRVGLAEEERALALVEAQLEVVEQQVRMFAELAEHTGEVLHAWAMTELNRIELEAERRYRQRLLLERRRVLGAGEVADER
jgi:hypothetical protein